MNRYRMSTPKRRADTHPRRTCIHEAGHALIRWYFGHHTDYACVRTQNEVRSGKRAPRGRGDNKNGVAWVQGPVIATPEEARQKPRAALVELVYRWGGVVAESRYSKRSLDECVIYGGFADEKDIDGLVNSMSGNNQDLRDALYDGSRDMAHEIICTEPAWRAINRIADVLQKKGYINGFNMHLICMDAYGAEQPEYLVYDKVESWPPTDKQLRSGALPPWK